MTLKFLILAALLAPAFSATAENAVRVLGLPLGGKFDAPKRKCSMNEIGAAMPRKFCWIERFNYKGSQSGDIQLPDDKNLPTWALHSGLKVSIGKDGVLNSVAVNTYDEKAIDEIAKSISSRFGPATSSHILRNGQVIEWRDREIDITIQCHRNGCATNFVSAAERSRRAIEIAAQKALDAARPTSP